MNKLIVALPYCNTDHAAATRLLNWIKELDGRLDHHLLLVADDAVALDTKKALNALGKEVFSSVETIMPRCPAPVNGNYHVPAAVMFERTASHIDSCYKWNWLWMEPDCVPLKSGWLDDLAEAYDACPKRFMGSTLVTNNADLPKVAFFATAIYPNCAHSELKQFCSGNKAFDMAFSDYVVPRGQASPLFQHVFGAPNDPPTFKEVRLPADGPNVGDLSNLSKEAVLWHRNKDGSLISLLRKSLFGPEPEDPTTELVEVPPIDEPLETQLPPPKNKGGRPRKVQPPVYTQG